MSRFFRVKIGRNTKPLTEPAISSSELKQSREMIDLLSRSIHSFFAREKKKKRRKGGREKKIVSIARDVLHPMFWRTVWSIRGACLNGVRWISTFRACIRCDIGRKWFRAHSYNFFSWMKGKMIGIAWKMKGIF